MRDVKLPGFEVELAENGYKVEFYTPAAKKALATCHVYVFGDLLGLQQAIEDWVSEIKLDTDE